MLIHEFEENIFIRDLKTHKFMRISKNIGQKGILGKLQSFEVVENEVIITTAHCHNNKLRVRKARLPQFA